MNRYRRARVPVVVTLSAVLTAALSACGASPLPADQVASTIVSQLKGQGVTVDDDAVTCPDELDAEVGQTVRCRFTAGGQPADAVATVSSVEGSRVNLDVATEAKPVPPQILERTVSQEFAKTGVQAEKVTCAGPLQPQVGQIQTCTLTAGGRDQALTTTVTEVRGALVIFSIQRS